MAYDITKRKKFETVGELKELLSEISDDAKVLVLGDDYAWFHTDKDGSVVNFDCEDLDDCYMEDELNNEEVNNI